jgi:hypothetical protein
MRKMIWATLTIAGLVMGTAVAADAAPVSRLLGVDSAVRATQVQQVDYNWNHHRYKHRSWDKRGRRWRYY